MRRVLTILLTVGALASLALPAYAQEGGRYYPETGHSVDGRFVDFFDGHGGLSILGYPITNSFVDPQTGWLIQYFQNTRVELAPDAGGVLTVRLSPLGEMLGGWQPPLSADMGTGSGCRLYAESGHSVCHAFLDYYLANGGPGLFGFPISEFKLENDRIVQYFQGFRLDWCPDDPSGADVRVAPLGRVHFDAAGYDPGLLQPGLPTDMLLYRIVELQPKASVSKPVVQPTDAEEIFVSVRDQNANPVSGASVTLVAHFPGGDRTIIMPLTDDAGYSRLTLTFEDQMAGTDVPLEFWIVRGEIQASSRDSFLIWW